MPLDRELDLDSPFSDFRHETVLAIIRTANLLAAVGADLFRRFDCTVAQFNVLFALKYKRRAVTQSELGRRLVVTRASITSVLDRLEDKGLVMRCSVPGNRRINHVELTDQGQTLINAMEPLYREAIHARTGALDEPACRQLIAFLEQIRGRIEQLGRP